MDFNTLIFVGFFAAATALNYLFPRVARPWFLLLASYVFYLYKPENARLVFVLITYTKIRTGGFFGYLKGFTQPIPVLTPFNIISELATPVSMAFRHFGNIISGSVINTLVYAALALASHGLLSLLFGWLPGAVGEVVRAIPFLQVGIPAVLSVYFDLFSSFMQAFIFCMLTMLYIASAAEED